MIFSLQMLMSVILVMENVNTHAQTMMVVSHVLVTQDINLIQTSIVQVDKHTHIHIQSHHDIHIHAHIYLHAQHTYIHTHFMVHTFLKTLLHMLIRYGVIMYA